MVDELGDSHDWFHSTSPLYGAKEKWFLIENHFSSARKVPHVELSPGARDLPLPLRLAAERSGWAAGAGTVLHHQPQPGHPRSAAGCGQVGS